MKKESKNMPTANATAFDQVQTKPMGFKLSILYFGIPTLAIFVGFHVAMPWLINVGLAPFYAYAFSLGVPLFCMLIASIHAFMKEGYTLNWKILRSRFRLQHMNLKLWIITILSALLILFIYGISNRLNFMLLQTGWIPVPDSLPLWLDTSKEMSFTGLKQAFGQLYDNWLALIAYFIFLVVNVLGEEFWWRGYILPRQELAFKKWTWVVHGFFWTFFHAFKWWDMIAILPITLILSFLVCRYKNNVIAIIIHFILNGIALIPILLGILGNV